MKKYFILIITVCLGYAALAQQTGSFTSTISFNGANRTLANFVPTNYDANQPHKLIIGLHGMGDGAVNYRNALVNALNFEAAFPNTILICPDGGDDQGRDFYLPEGDELIIEEAINFARDNYNIDTKEIILQGFSLGGRSALKYGLENTTKFKALLLNTPAIQGVKEAVNKAYFTYNFAAAKELPIYITVGNDDLLYVEPINLVVAKLVANEGKVAYKTFTGGHTVPSFKNYPYAAFFNQPANNGLDAGIYQLTLPERSCNGVIEAALLLQNTGNVNIDSVQLVYGIGNSLDTFNWVGNLTEYQSERITLPAYNTGNQSTDHYDFKVIINGINDHVLDTFTDFNASIKSVHVMLDALSLPFEERFNDESSLTKWAFNNSGDIILPFEFYEEDESLYSLNTIFIFDNAGTREEVISPKLDLSNQSSAYLHFKVDYNYVKYKAEDIDTIFADSLEVLVTTDCGLTYTPLFKKGGAELSGHAEPLLNPLSVEAFFIEKDESKLKGFTIDVSQFAGKEDVAFKFSYISALGGYIYLDDIVVNNSPVSVKKVAVNQSGFQVFPNPADAQLHIVSSEKAIESIVIYNVMGQEVMSVKGNGEFKQQIDISHVSAGNYWMQIISPEGEISKANFLKR